MINHAFIRNGRTRQVKAAIVSSSTGLIIAAIHDDMRPDLSGDPSLHLICELPYSVAQAAGESLVDIDYNFDFSTEDRYYKLQTLWDYLINVLGGTGTIVVDQYTFEISDTQAQVVPDMEPYKVGTIVFDIRHGTASLSKDVGSQQFIGKILSFVQIGKTYRYNVQFLERTLNLLHENLLPANNYFDKCEYQAYQSLVDCNSLFFKNQKFLLRGGYLYNKDSSVILSYARVKKLFKQIQNEAAI